MPVVVVVVVVVVVSPRGIPTYQAPHQEEGVESHGLIDMAPRIERVTTVQETSHSARAQHIPSQNSNRKLYDYLESSMAFSRIGSTQKLLQLELGMYRTVTYTPGPFLAFTPVVVMLDPEPVMDGEATSMCGFAMWLV